MPDEQVTTGTPETAPETARQRRKARQLFLAQRHDLDGKLHFLDHPDFTTREALVKWATQNLSDGATPMVVKEIGELKIRRVTRVVSTLT